MYVRRQAGRLSGETDVYIYWGHLRAASKK